MVSSASRIMVMVSGLTLLAVPSLLAQETRGTISGLVRDSSGAVVAGAGVTATNTATQVVITGTTNAQGSYRISFLDPGPYLVKASLAGFKMVEQKVDLRTGDSLQLDFTLEVGAITESVEVTGAAPLLETASADRGLLIDNRRITTIPLAQGNPIFLVTLTNGANPGASDTAFKFDEPAYNVVADFSFQGAPGGTNAYTMNGLSNSLTEFGGSVGPALQPPTDAVQEFKINQSFSAEQGHTSGTSIDIALKTGTNGLHGSVYGFFRESEWEANSFFNNLAGNPKTDTTYRRLGFAVNGPVYLPKTYNGKNQTFFSYSFEDTKQRSLELIGTETIPTRAQLNGDFSQLLSVGPNFQIYDPLTTTATGTGFFQRTPFLNNIIPATRVHPISKNLSQYWPEPNTAGGRDGSSNFRPNTPSPTNWYQWFARLDQNFTSNTRLFVHYGILDSDIQWKDTFDNLSTGHRQFIVKRMAGLDLVHVLSTNLLLNVRYGILRVTDPRFEKSHVRNPDGGYDIRTLGLDPNFVRQLDLSQNELPHIFIEGYRGISDDVRNNQDNSDVHNVALTTDYNRGKHNVKIGYESWFLRYNRADLRWTMPRYQFGSTYTRGPFNNSPAAPLGQGLAAFLLGQHSGGFISRKDSFAAYNPYHSIFVHDNWRVTPKLTLNLGLRSEYYGSVIERFNRSTRGFDFTSPNPIEAAARAAYARNPIPEIPIDQFRVRGGLLFAGAGRPRNLYEPTPWLLAPRFGLAYRLGNNTVMRGGYGIYYLPLGLDGRGGFLPRLNGFNRDTEFIPTFDEGVTFVADIRNPVPSGINDPLKASAGLLTDIGQSVDFANTSNLAAPYMQRWSVGVQRLLRGDVLVEASYVASRGTKLIMNQDVNALPLQYLSTQSSRDERTISYLTESVRNPFAGLLPGSSLNTQFTNRSQLFRTFPHFRSVVAAQTNQGYSWYHSLETKLEKRFSKGHSYIVNYTWSKDMQAISRLNDADPTPYESLSPADRTHRLTVTSIFELPFGAGKRFGAGAPAGLSKVISGWEVSAVWQFQSGFPLTFPDLFTEGPLQDVALSSDQRRLERWFNTEAGFVRDSRRQPSFHVRTFPFRFGDIRSDRLNFWDISLVKNTRITEKTNIQFQAQFLNAFNHPSFAAVNTNPTSGSFGRVTGDMTWPRRIMFGLRFLF